MTDSTTPASETPPSVDGDARPLPFPVVGVGASAGGLEALTKLVEGLPPNPGLAFLVTLHLQPHTESQLAELLQRVTPLPVRQASHGDKVEPNHIYIIPPNTVMSMSDGSVALTTRPPRGVRCRYERA